MTKKNSKPSKKKTVAKKAPKKASKKVVKKTLSKKAAKPKKKATIAKKSGVQKDISYHVTSDSISVTYPDNGKRTTKIIDSSNPEFVKVRQAIKDGKLSSIPGIIERNSKLVRTYIANDQTVRFENGSVEIRVKNQFKRVPVDLSKRIIAYANEGLPINDLKAFFRNLMNNPSMTSVESLFRFLSKNHFPLTADGCFIAYKSVDNEFKDHHSGTFDNSIGKIVRMDRNMVDENIHQACSHGLHVASFNYAINFMSGGKLLEVKVNPKDVVAVPWDERDEKMRVCEYKVIGLSTAEILSQRFEYVDCDDDDDDDCDDDYDDYDYYDEGDK